MERLENKADLLASQPCQLALAGPFHAHTVELDRARVGTIETAEEVEEGRLAGARTTDDRDELSGRELQIDAVENLQGSTAGTERPYQAPPASDDLHRPNICRRWVRHWRGTIWRVVQLNANAALHLAVAHPLEREVVAGLIPGGRPRDPDFARAFSGGLAVLSPAERVGLGGITGHIAESVVEMVLVERGWTPVWHFAGPGGHGVDLLFLDSELARLVAVEVKGTLRPGVWPRLRRAELTQMDVSWLDKPDNPAMMQWDLTSTDVYGAIAIANLADLRYRLAVTGDLSSWSPITELTQLDDLSWLDRT